MCVLTGGGRISRGRLIETGTWWTQTSPKFSGTVPFSVKKKVMGFPVNPRATTPSPVLLLPQWSADFHLVTGVSLLVIPRGCFHNPPSSRMAQTHLIVTTCTKGPSVIWISSCSIRSLAALLNCSAHSGQVGAMREASNNGHA
jgi:hypothetical protein